MKKLISVVLLNGLTIACRTQLPDHLQKAANGEFYAETLKAAVSKTKAQELFCTHLSELVDNGVFQIDTVQSAPSADNNCLSENLEAHLVNGEQAAYAAYGYETCQGETSKDRFTKEVIVVTMAHETKLGQVVTETMSCITEFTDPRFKKVTYQLERN